MKPAQSKELQLRAMREARFTQHQPSKQKPVKAKPESAAEIVAHIREQYGMVPAPITVGVVPTDPTPAPKRRRAKRRNKAAKRQRRAK